MDRFLHHCHVYIDCFHASFSTYLHVIIACLCFDLSYLWKCIFLFGQFCLKITLTLSPLWSGSSMQNSITKMKIQSRPLLKVSWFFLFLPFSVRSLVFHFLTISLVECCMRLKMIIILMRSCNSTGDLSSHWPKNATSFDVKNLCLLTTS